MQNVGFYFYRLNIKKKNVDLWVAISIKTRLECTTQFKNRSLDLEDING